jgi:glyoxylase-like metal-dependent hydrolase (beta-lactamase superfamily II)
MTTSNLHVESLFDEATSTFSHLVMDRTSQACALIDSVLDYDPKSGRTSTASADRLIARVRELGARVLWMLETHVHADHLSAAPYSSNAPWAAAGHRPRTSPRCRRCSATCSTPGRTSRATAASSSACSPMAIRWTIGTCRLTRHAHPRPHAGLHDLCGHVRRRDGRVRRRHAVHARLRHRALRLPRAAMRRTLYRSIRKVLALPPATRLYMCHDYAPGGRGAWSLCPPSPNSARGNIHVHDGVAEDDFVAMRKARDATLAMPALHAAFGAGQHAGRASARWPRPMACST